MIPFIFFKASSTLGQHYAIALDGVCHPIGAEVGGNSEVPSQISREWEPGGRLSLYSLLILEKVIQKDQDLAC